MVAGVAQHMRVIGVERVQTASVEFVVALADLNHVAQALVDFACVGRRVVALAIQRFVVVRTVRPAAVVALVAVARPFIVVERAHFVAEVNQRQAAGTEGDAV